MNQKRNYENFTRTQKVTPDDARRYLALRRQFLKALADAGAPLLMGTDTPQMFNVAGFALHRELKLARAAGLTPWQVLESGTRNVGRYVAEDLKQASAIVASFAYNAAMRPEKLPRKPLAEE